MIEPNCDMPWEIYLDWLQDQGNEDLRYIDVFSLSFSYIWETIDNWFGCPGGRMPESSAGEVHYDFPYNSGNVTYVYGNGYIDSESGDGSVKFYSNDWDEEVYSVYGNGDGW